MAQVEPKIAELLEYVVRELVDVPDEVRINEVRGRRLTVYEVSVAAGDWGKVIGKEGRIANAIRTVVKAAAAPTRQSVAVEIMT